MHIYNCDRWMNVYCRFFHITKISEIDIILNYLWLYAVNSEIDWKKQTWQYLIDSEQVFIVDSEKFTLKMKKVRQIFTVMLTSLMKAGQFTQITLFRELTDFQNVIIIKKELILSLYKTTVHYINMKN